MTAVNNEDLRARVTAAVASICRPHPDCEPVPNKKAIVDAVMAIFEPPYPPLGLEGVTGVPASWWNAAEAAYRTALLRAVKESWRGPKVLERAAGSGAS